MNNTIVKPSRKEFEELCATTRTIYHEFVPNLKEATSDFEFLLSCVKKKEIKIRPTGTLIVEDSCNTTIKVAEPVEEHKPKKRGRRPKASNQECTQSESSESVSLDDSTSSTRSRRGAAVAADQKLAQVHSLMKATKLRRPTNFDEKESKRAAVASSPSPPAKCRRTYLKSAGSSSEGSSPKQNVNHQVKPGKVVGSKKKIGKRKSEDIFSDSPVHSESPIAQSSPVSSESCKAEGGFNGFNLLPLHSDAMKEAGQKEMENKKDESVVNNKQNESPTRLKNSRTKVIRKAAQPPKENGEEPMSISSDEESKSRSRTKTIKKGTRPNDTIEESHSKYLTSEFKLPAVPPKSPAGDAMMENGQEEMENKKDEAVVDNKQNESPKKLKNSRTKVLRKAAQPPEENNGEQMRNSSDEESKSRSRTKTIKKETQPNDASEESHSKYLTSSFKLPAVPLKSLAGDAKMENGQEEMESKKDEAVVDNKQNESPKKLKNSRTKVLRKAAQPPEENNGEQMRNSSDEESKSRSRTKTIKKETQPNDAIEESHSKYLTSSFKLPAVPLKSLAGDAKMETGQEEENKKDESVVDNKQNESPTRLTNSRTKVLRKAAQPPKENGEEPICISSDEESTSRSRTKTIKKGTRPNDAIEESHSKYLTSAFKLPAATPKSPAGELVKKRVEGFENLKKVEVDVEATGRCTRNALKNKASSSSTESQSTKQHRGEVQLTSRVQNAKRAPLVKGKQNLTKEDKENIGSTKVAGANKTIGADSRRMTPLGSNRLNPAINSNQKLLVVNKGLSSATKQSPVETNTTLVQKVVSEDIEKKKEEEKLKHEAKERDAMKKKENALKSTADSNRRKREDKIQRAAAAREAAEKEKALLVVKAQIEKEEKIRQIAAEKEKQKEEHLKKKLLMQQKAQEHEERRKQEEAARLAKIKEQEEEHKRVLAMKEREREILKHQKATELKLAEAEKAKQQGCSKVAKIAVVAVAKLQTQQPGTTPMKPCDLEPPVQSYEITPARDERPLLKSKTKDDYGIDDIKSDDSSDDEIRPKKEIPKWARPENRARLLKTTFYLSEKLLERFMKANPRPDINQLFAGNPIRKRIRTSSAVWNDPPMSPS